MANTSEKQIVTIGFYNLENLFDTKNDPDTLDDDFTESSEKNWTEDRLKNKIEKLGRTISKLGLTETSNPPCLVGVAEVENRVMLRKLTRSKKLKDQGYDIVHIESPDERGIDTGLIYRKDLFTVISSEALMVYLEDERGERDFTRDILYVKGTLEGLELHVLVNHWPSRRSGEELSNHKRLTAAARNREKIEEILLEDPQAKIVVMGDFNDDPSCESLKKLAGEDLYNPMELLHTKYQGSLNYRGNWNLFDQILLSNSFMRQHGNSFRFVEANIYDSRDLQEFEGKYKGNPFRTYVGPKYLGGYSDHFPIYALFSIEN